MDLGLAAAMAVVWASCLLLPLPPWMLATVPLLVVASLGAFVASRVNEVRFDDAYLEVRVINLGTVRFDRARLASFHQRFTPGPFGPTIEVFHLERQQPGRRRTVGVSLGLYRRRDREQLREVLAGPPPLPSHHSASA